MENSKLLITGCARSGTGYVAALLSKLGLPTGHERVFFPGAKVPSWDGYTSECSWLAGNQLLELPVSTTVIHLYRDPAKVIKSHCDLKFFDDDSPPHHAAYLAIARTVIDDYPILTPHERAEAYWVGWNRIISKHIRRFHTHMEIRLEKLKDAEYLQHALHAVGRQDLVHNIDRALKAVPCNQNHKTKDKAVNLAPQSLASAAGLALAARLGYLDLRR